MKPALGAVIGAAGWFGFWWLTGLDFPSERGGFLIFFVFNAAACALCGMTVAVMRQHL